MLPDEDDKYAELERLVSDAKPTLDRASQNRLAYATGFAAGRNQALSERVSKRGRSRWLSMASHAACALAAGWLTFAVLPTINAPTDPEPQVATGKSPSLVRAAPTPSVLTYTSPTADGILRPSISPSRLVDTINSYNGESTQSVSITDSAPILNSRSFIF